MSASTTSSTHKDALKILEHEHLAFHTDLYWVIRAVPKNLKAPLLAWHAFVNTCRAISERTQHEEVAPIKLAWWQNEIHRLFEGEPQHPITQVLVEHLDMAAITSTPFEAIIEASQLALETEVYPDQADLNHHFQHTGGIVVAAHAKWLGYGDTETQQAALHQLGIGLEIIRHLQQVPTNLGHHKVYLPESGCPSSIAMLLADHSEETLRPMLEAQAAITKGLISDALPDLPALPRSIKRMVRVALLRLKLLEKNSFPVLSQRIEPGVLQKLWCCV